MAAARPRPVTTTRRESAEPINPAALPLLEFIPALNAKYERPDHLAPLVEMLARAETEEVRALVSVPPQHGKSQTILAALVWLMRRNPKLRHAYASFGAKVAHRQSLSCRDMALAAGVDLRDDARAVGGWMTRDGGGLFATSLPRGQFTSVPVDGVLVVDDPHSNREDAESALARGRVHDWFTSTASARLHPGASVIVCHCMVGGTPVLMADGTEKPLRTVRTGDSVATYDGEALSTSVVRNWANQGPDFVFAITTSSGTVVRANERHPFLVERGGNAEWVKLRDLRIGDAIVRATPPGDSGAVLCAPLRDATSLQSARGCAARITARQELQPATDAPHTPPRIGAELISGTGTASITPSTTPFYSSKKAAAQCAVSRQGRTSQPSGAEGSPSTTTTRPGRCVGCSATDAISPSATVSPQTSWSEPLSTYAITLDRIVSIIEDGTEDVFDIEVETTENFIANGLVSHNTRWHPDDLIGRLSKETTKDANGNERPVWEHINLPAIKADGTALWHRRPLEYLEKYKRNDYDWWSLYMGSPRPRGSAVFSGVSFYDRLPVRYRIGKGVDLAYTAKTHADWSVGITMLAAEDEKGEPLYYVVDVKRKQAEVPDFARELAAASLEWRGAWHWFCSTTEKGLAQLLTSHGIDVDPVLATADKFVRAQPASGAWNAGRILVPRNMAALLGDRATEDDYLREPSWLRAFVDEVGTFTGVGDVRDDQVDALASAFESVRHHAPPPKIVKGSGSRWEADERGFG